MVPWFTQLHSCCILLYIHGGRFSCRKALSLHYLHQVFLHPVMQIFSGMFLCFCNKLFQTWLSIWIFRKMFPLLSFKGDFISPVMKCFLLVYSIKRRYLSGFNVYWNLKCVDCPWPWTLSTRALTELYSQICSWRGVDILASGSILMSRKLLSDVILLS